MAEKFNQVNPLAPSNGHARSDEEAANSPEKVLKRQKRIKLAIYIAIFAVFQMIVIGVFGAVVMKAKTPKFRLSNNVQVQKLDAKQESSSSSSFDLSFTTQVRIKNPNFGPYKFYGTTMTFTYQGTAVGEITIPKGKAGFKSTKKIDVGVSLNSTQLESKAGLGTELSGGTLTLGSSATMNGKAELMWIMKKKKSTNMNCTIVFAVQPKTLTSLKCK